MKLLLLSVITAITAWVSETPAEVEKVSKPEMVLQDSDGSGRMPSIVFKMQDYCRVELKDFEFDITFKVLSANVYFTGENFRGVEPGSIQGNSLSNIKHLMKRCVPGSIVTFDNIRVMGPDNEVRVLPGVSYVLY